MGGACEPELDDRQPVLPSLLPPPTGLGSTQRPPAVLPLAAPAARFANSLRRGDGILLYPPRLSRLLLPLPPLRPGAPQGKVGVANPGL